MRLRDGFAAATFLATAAAAATASAQPVTGFYVGAGVGGNLLQNDTVRFSPALSGLPPFTSLAGSKGRWERYEIGALGVASVGYGFGNGVRVELEGSTRWNEVRHFPGGNQPTVARGDRFTYAGMVNALFDLDVGSPYVFPYLGVGAGIAAADQDTVRSAGTTSPFAIRMNDTDYAFAYQAIIGASFPIPPVVGLSLTAEYRFFGTATERTYNATETVGAVTVRGKVRQDESFNHSVLVGLRYAFNVAPPPPPPVVAQPAPQPPAAARTYLVFFDWDRADLTARARQIVAEAARASQSTGTTRIEVAGHADRSGTPRYNQGLSLRRANAVAAELVRDGVPRNAISVTGYGESRPLVPTADGVREPQNRRVEIVLQ